MAVHTTRDSIRSDLDEYLDDSCTDDEMFVAAMPTWDEFDIAQEHVPWFALTTDRLIRYQKLLWIQNVSEFRLSEIAYIEHESSVIKDKWAIAGEGLYQKYTTDNDATDEFLNCLRDNI